MFRVGTPSNVDHIIGLNEIKEIQDLINDEVSRAEVQFSSWPADLIMGDQIINEEKGEATKALLDFAQGKTPIDDVLNEYIQTAAMCVRHISALRQFIGQLEGI